MRSLLACALALTLAATPRIADACLWDYDTLKEESLGQADAAAVIGGDLHKHSKAFYEAKVEYTRALVAKGNATKDRYDDLAVALAKLGKHDDAIAILADKEQKFPGEYTTEANLGTFLAMKGDTKGALDHLKKAIAINPDAHFGREKFQIQLLEYLQRVASNKTLPEKENFLGIEVGKDHAGESAVIIHVSRGHNPKVKLPTPPVAAIVGLMRFGDGQDNPHLWYALGWALVDQGNAQLAVRAFRRGELLGHPRAGKDGAVVSTTIYSLGAICCDPPESPKVQIAWGKITKVADAEWAKGQAADARRQAAEDAKIAKQQLKAVFGY